ncbi:MAG TPA: hypothetical protein VK437_06025 [Steroidobacteraceae bacterium]|nr:hypothetical protein [Steroidobacteraceae bacterium]
MRYALIGLLFFVAAAAGWTWFTLSWAYSDGTRAGVLQKLSRKGWICKTEEGELAQYVVAGVSPQIWQFSVRDRAIGTELEKVVGSRVQLHYTEHPGVPSSCFADTRYFVDHVTVIETVPAGSLAPPPPNAAAPAAPGPAPSSIRPPGTSSSSAAPSNP